MNISEAMYALVERTGYHLNTARKVQAEGKDDAVEVTVGLQNEREVEVMSGVNEGDRIRIRPASADPHTARM